MSLKKAKEYYYNGRLEQAFSELEHLAKNGDGEAMLELSRWYKSGRYVKASIKKAERWCKKAQESGEQNTVVEFERIQQAADIYRMIEAGDPFGDYLLAQAYEEGEVFEKDLSLAVFYYRKAMEQENILAISKLQELRDLGEENAQMLFLELGLDPQSDLYDPQASCGLCYQILCSHPDNKRAKELLQKGTVLMDAEAEFYLGKYLFEQFRNQEERAQGLKLLTKVADRNRQEALLLLAEACTDEKGIAGDLDKAALYYQKLHELGNLTGTYRLAECYRRGLGVQKETETADYLLQFAADGGQEEAILDIRAETAGWESEGSRHFYGQEGRKEYEQAVNYYSAAYENSILSPEGTRNLAFCILNGLGTHKDVTYAMQLYQQAADAGDDQAQYFVGNCCRYGFNGYLKADDLGVSYYKLSAAQGNPDAMSALAFCLLHGIGTEPDEKMAWTCYEKAAESGSREAENMLRRKKDLL